MAQITLKGTPWNTNGDIISKENTLPEFQLVNKDLETVSKSSFSGKKIVLNCFPSIDTPVCAESVKTFNQKATENSDVQVLCISEDLPFAFNRFCGAEGIENVTTLSAFRDKDFSSKLGIQITNGPLEGLYARAIIVADENGKVI